LPALASICRLKRGLFKSSYCNKLVELTIEHKKNKQKVVSSSFFSFFVKIFSSSKNRFLP
jgi:hypothetical protein